MKTIGIIAQKGGQGKSFFTMLFSKFVNERKNKVLIIDGDFPQHTIKKLRDDEHNFLKNNDDSYCKKAKIYLKTNGQVDILSSEPQELERRIDEHKKNYDYIFLDFTGSLNVKGLDFGIFGKMDNVIVPTRVAPDDVRSNFEFCLKILNPLKLKYNFNYFVIFNMVENTKVDIKRLEMLQNFCQKNGINFFKNFIFKRKIYERHCHNNGGGKNSTILPIHLDIMINNLHKEARKIIL